MLTTLRPLVALLALLTGLVACGQPAPTLTGAAIPAGWQPQQPPGFTLALPPSWQVITANEADTPGALDALAGTNAQLRPSLEAAKQLFATGQVRLMAFDLEPSHMTPGFTTNLSLGVLAAAGADLKAVRTANLQQLRTTPAFEAVTDSTTTIAGLPAAQLGYTMRLTDPGGVAAPLQVAQYLWVYQDRQYVATFTTTPDQAAAFAPTFKQILETIRVTP